MTKYGPVLMIAAATITAGVIIYVTLFWINTASRLAEVL